jgi:hypothetical protein
MKTTDSGATFDDARLKMYVSFGTIAWRYFQAEVLQASTPQRALASRESRKENVSS